MVLSTQGILKCCVHFVFNFDRGEHFLIYTNVSALYCHCCPTGTGGDGTVVGT